MSRNKTENFVDTPKKGNKKPTGYISKEGEHDVPRTIIISNGLSYTETLLLNRIKETGLLDDYIGGREITDRSMHWLEYFPRTDIIQIFTMFPNVYQRCHDQMSKTIGPVVTSVPLFNDMFCNLFENVLEKAKNIHLKHHWGFGENTAEFVEFELAISFLYTFLEEDSKESTSKTPSLSTALDKFAESDFVNLQNVGLSSISAQLYKISQRGHCSAGFVEQLSRIYTAMTVARAVLFYGNVLQKQPSENTGEPRDDSNFWDYRRAEGFFKMKPELKKEMEFPLYHGNIDTNKAKNILKNPGEYLARYSSNYNKHYFTILLDANTLYNKIVLNFIIPPEKVEAWIKEPIENRKEIERFIRDQLSMKQPSSLQPFVARFFTNEQYSPVFNPVSNADILNASFRL